MHAGAVQRQPRGCPPASKIGHAKVHTPLLPVPLEGPANFVSNGGEAFPNLTMVLQGYGVTIDLVGDTFISKAGITSTTFKTVPDQPFSTFELTLPEGPYSALAANGNLCAPTTTETVKKKVTVERSRGRKKTVTREDQGDRARIPRRCPTNSSLRTAPTIKQPRSRHGLHQGSPRAVKPSKKAKKKKKRYGAIPFDQDFAGVCVPGCKGVRLCRAGFVSVLGRAGSKTGVVASPCWRAGSWR